MNRIPSLDGLISISLVVAGDWMELHDHSDIAGAFAKSGSPNLLHPLKIPDYDVAAERASEDLDD